MERERERIRIAKRCRVIGDEKKGETGYLYWSGADERNKHAGGDVKKHKTAERVDGKRLLLVFVFVRLVE